MNEKEFNEKIGNNIRKYRLMYNANGGYMSQREISRKNRSISFNDRRIRKQKYKSRSRNI